MVARNALGIRLSPERMIDWSDYKSALRASKHSVMDRHPDLCVLASFDSIKNGDVLDSLLLSISCHNALES